MSTKITKHAFSFGTQKYFRGNAHLVQICSYGEKKDSIGAPAYLDVQSKVKTEHLTGRVKFNGVTPVDWGQTNEADVEVNGELKVFGIGIKLAVGTPFSKVSSAKLQLANFAINEGPLRNLLNEDASGARKFLAGEGRDGRIVSEVWVVMEAELASHFSSSPTVAVTVGALGSELEIVAKGGSQGTQTISLSPGTTFAYKLHKVTKWNDDKTRVLEMEADYKGMG